MAFEILMGILQIFTEVYKISTKHSKIMASILLVSICIQSMNHFFLDGVKENIKTLLGVKGIFVLVNWIASFLLSIATVIASAWLYGGKCISPKDLVQATIKSWRKPFATMFFTALFFACFLFFFSLILLLLLMIADRPDLLLSISVTVAILGSIPITYLAVVWTLAFVLSVLEDRCGIKALSKAAEIVKGMKLKGFTLNLVFIILFSVTEFQGPKLITLEQSTELTRVIIGLILVVLSCLVRMIHFMAFTVFYYECKKIHGEKVELQGGNCSSSTEYVKIASTPLSNENLNIT